jgi:hypothetical protein
LYIEKVALFCTQCLSQSLVYQPNKNPEVYLPKYSRSENRGKALVDICPLFL